VRRTGRDARAAPAPRVVDGQARQGVRRTNTRSLLAGCPMATACRAYRHRTVIERDTADLAGRAENAGGGRDAYANTRIWTRLAPVGMPSASTSTFLAFSMAACAISNAQSGQTDE
jgi:hypothetical protein